MGGWIQRIGGLLAATATGIALSAPTADAAVSCVYTAGAPNPGDELATVTMTGAGDVAAFTVGAGGAINVNGSACQAATTGNTAIVLVDDTSGSAASARVEIDQPATFTPGTAGEGEVEFVLDMENGADVVELTGGAAPNRFVVGGAGVNFNEGPGDTDLDISYITGTLRLFELTGGPDADLLSAQGGGATLGPFASGMVTIEGSGGNDTIDGGNGALASNGDRLSGGIGNDVVRGFGAKDFLFPDPGNDTLDCGAGSEDTLDYSLVQGGVTIDLASSAPQTNGPIGTDTIAGGCEVVRGTGEGDVLSGADAAEFLIGRGGNDVLNGRGGADALAGEGGIDTVTYADAPAGVAVDLSAAGSTGGDVSITDVENLIGSPFADTLTGSALANSITGLSGDDTISALAGPDSVDVRDGSPDTASCGTELDTATADRASVDTVDPDCETVSFLPEPDPGGDGDPGGGGGGATDAELRFDLAAKKKQRVLKRKGVVVRASCPLEDCTATASGAARVPKPRPGARAKLPLKPVTAAVDAGVTERLRLKLRKKQLRAIAAALRAGKKPKVTVTASGSDAAGNVATDDVVVRAKP